MTSNMPLRNRDVTNEILREYAGVAYDHILQDKESALAHLSDADGNVRIAAIIICATRWNCLRDPAFTNKCLAIAAADLVVAVRVHAINCISWAFESTRDQGVSRFLADLTSDATSVPNLRSAAYWALRRVQLGDNEDDLIAQSHGLMKQLATKLTVCDEDIGRKSVEQTPVTSVQEFAYIDWAFVNRFASCEK